MMKVKWLDSILNITKLELKHKEIVEKIKEVQKTRSEDQTKGKYFDEYT